MRPRSLIFRRRFLLPVVVLAALGVLFSCTDLSGPEHFAPGDAALAKGGGKGGSGGGGGGGSDSSVTVSGAVPDTAYQGTTLDVTITGSGFTSDMDVIWELGGVADPTQVRTNSTRFVNSKELVANITVAPEATPTKWDIRVQSRGTCCKGGVGVEMFEVKVDPRATWLLPTSDGTMSFVGDGQFVDEGQSVYADGVCGVTAKVFATTEASHSGDATFNTGGKPGDKTACARTITLRYPDGFSETLHSFANVRELQNTEFSIPVGGSARRMLAINPSVYISGRKGTRCGRLIFGEEPGGPGGKVRGPGSDSVLVTRLDARTWQVETTVGNHRGWCENTGQLLVMPIRFFIITNRDLP